MGVLQVAVHVTDGQGGIVGEKKGQHPFEVLTDPVEFQHPFSLFLVPDTILTGRQFLFSFLIFSSVRLRRNSVGGCTLKSRKVQGGTPPGGDATCCF
ncbi:hypothetical protein GCM10008938_46930 [Deinococcus roseus]|uniref:Uncharacterized protein n=1 Tax=Deinococcus roseus TaxID=392414 RepID=A0ABQ2DEQ0_9DEIO|nr:hypothetical protein GCM10008938_46930 [Deinococcus roseus]